MKEKYQKELNELKSDEIFLSEKKFMYEQKVEDYELILSIEDPEEVINSVVVNHISIEIKIANVLVKELSKKLKVVKERIKILRQMEYADSR